MVISYLSSSGKKSANASCADFELMEKREGNRVVVSLKAKTDITLLEAKERLPFHVNDKDLYFLNGYQSWTDTREYPRAKVLRNVKHCPRLITHMYRLPLYGDAIFYSYHKKKSHGYDVFYAKGDWPCFLYSYNYDVAYLLVEIHKDDPDLHLYSLVDGIALKAGEEVKVFDYVFFDDYEKGLEAYQKDFPIVPKEKVFGYTSWYNYYQNINESIILRDLEGLDERFNVFQIDDGYETFVGDWLDVDPMKFPHGLEPIVEKIHEKGLKAGLWLAPFVVESKAKLFQEHPDWIVHDAKGRLCRAGGNWSGDYALDLQNPEVVEYIRKFLTHYKEMGFDFFKLDFLYAAAIYPVKGKSRCQVQAEAYQLLRDILGDKLILGCGANIINCYKRFDYLRIGPDVSLSFDDKPIMRLLHRERVSTKVTLQNTIFRHIFDQRLFGNDPDVFLLRDDNIQLSKMQRLALTKLNALFGSVLMTSDNIGEYDDEKKAILAEALDLFQNAKVLAVETKGDLIDIAYSLRKEKKRLVYNTQLGVFIA